MKKKKQEQVSLFEINEPVKKEVIPIVTKDNVTIGLIGKSKPVKETIFEPLKESLKDTYKLMTTNHYFLASDESENICRLCGKHGRNQIHGRSRK